MSKFRFAQFVLDMDRGELLEGGVKLDLEPQVYCLLEILISKHGTIVSRKEIIEAVWDGRHVANGTVDSRIKSARAILGDNGRDQNFIKTYPNRGYRFVGHVEEVSCDKAARSETEIFNTPKANRARHLNFRHHKFAIACAAAIFLFAIGGAYTFWASGPFDRPNQVGDGGRLAASVRSSGPQETAIGVLPLDVNSFAPGLEHLFTTLDTEFRQAITTIQGVSVVTIAPETRPSNALNDPEDVAQGRQASFLLKPRLIVLGDEVSLRAELLRIPDNVLLWSGRYTLGDIVNDEALVSWSSASAIRATIEVANTLELPMNERAAHLLAFEFQEKVSRARQLIVTDEFDDLSEAILLLIETVEEEPDYLPAYQALYYAYWRRLSFVGDGFENDAREILNLTAAMERISPNATETLVAKAFSSSTVLRGTSKTSAVKARAPSWHELLTEVIERNPDNTIARNLLAYFMQHEAQFRSAEILQANEEALHLSPTDPTVLANYSEALLCAGDLTRSLHLAESNISWNPESSAALSSIAGIARAKGDYHTALLASDPILRKGLMQHDQARVLRALYFDLGIADRIVDQVGFPPAKAHVLAMMGNVDAALEEAAVIPGYYANQVAKLTAANDLEILDYRPHPYYTVIGDTIEGYSAKPCALNYLAIDAFGLSRSDPERSVLFIELLVRYFSDRDSSVALTAEEHLGLISLHILEGNPGLAMQALDAAIEEGFILTGRFKGPVLSQLISERGFSERQKTMQEMANEVISNFDQVSAQRGLEE